MPLLDDINRVLRDFERYTGDGKPGAPSAAPLPTGDPSSGRRNIPLHDLRELLKTIAQAVGDPAALQEIIDGLGTKADSAFVDQLTAAFVPSVNIFNRATVSAGQAIDEATGALLANANSVASDFMPVQGGMTYRFSTLQRLAWYTASRTFISGQLTTGTNVDRTAPANASFLRISLPSTTNLATHMITLASDWPESYVGYGLVPDLEKLALPEGRLSDWWQRDYLVPGKNMVNEATSTIGAFVNSETGAVQPNASLRATAMIPVEGGATYAFSGGDAGFVGSRAVAQYNAAGALIPKPMAATSPLYATSVTVDPNARFVRVSYHNSAAGAFQMERGTAPTAYRPYSLAPVPTAADGTPIDWGLGSGNGEAVPYAYSYGLERLREARTRIMAYRLGLSGRQSQLHIGVLGDSWAMIPTYFVRWFARSLWGRLLGSSGYSSSQGMIGRGYMTFREDNASGTKSTTRLDAIGEQMTISGAWSRLTNSQASASINGQQSSEAGAYVEWPMDYAQTPARSLTLHAQGGAGVLRYRWTDAGAWTTINLAGMPAGLAVVPLTGNPTSGTGTLRLEVVSGTVTLFGIMELATSAPGVAVSNLGGSGSTSAQWVAVNRAQFIAAIAATGCDMFEVVLGTNDASVGTSQAQFKANIREIVERLREARPTADVLLTAPAQNTDPARPVPVRLYAEAMFELAQEMDVAFIDLQPSFGVNAADYAPGSQRPYFGDQVHPNQLGALSWSHRVLDAIGL